MKNRIGARVAILGAGSMGTVLAEGIIRKGVFDAQEVSVTGRGKAENLAKLRSLGAKVEEGNRSAVEKSGVVILCVKPKDMGNLLNELGDACRGKLVISIAAGVSIGTISRRLAGARVVRTMLNVCVEAGKTATAVCYGKQARKSDRLETERVFSGFGMVLGAKQGQMAAFTALAGCMPALLFELMGRLEKFASERGFSAEVSRELAAQVFEGSSRVFRASKKGSAKLVQSVMSKRGATEKMFESLDKSGFFKAFEPALLEAEKRTEELGREINGVMKK